MKILEELNKQFNFKYDFLRVLKVDYNTLLSFAEIIFMYPENHDELTDEEKNEIINFVQKTLKLSCEIKIKFKKSYLDKNLIKKSLINYLKTEHSSMFAYYNEDNIEILKNENNIYIKINLMEIIYKYFKYNNLKINIENYLNNNFIANFNVEGILNNNMLLKEEDLYQREQEVFENLPKQKPVERYEVVVSEILIGSQIMPMPEYIKNQKDEKNNVILAGVISNLVEKTFISQRNKKKGITEPSFYYAFTLTDSSQSVRAVYFSNNTTRKKAKVLKDGDVVLLKGNLKKGMRDMSLHIHDISFCEIEKKITPIVKSNEPLHISDYQYVHPTEYAPMKQENLFDIKPQYNDEIMNNTFVVFDLETTGLRAEDDEMIEIGAVKVVNGVIKEQFQTFVCPDNEIPKEITKLTSITNEMVVGAPKSTEVIYDFYKFCENCTLVGYNVTFDMSFIKKSGRDVNLIFPNKVLDAMVLAKQKLFLPKYKLVNVVDALQIKLDNAHRAIYDATATAYVFLKLNEIEKND